MALPSCRTPVTARRAQASDLRNAELLQAKAALERRLHEAEERAAVLEQENEGLRGRLRGSEEAAIASRLQQGTPADTGMEIDVRTSSDSSVPPPVSFLSLPPLPLQALDDRVLAAAISLDTGLAAAALSGARVEAEAGSVLARHLEASGRPRSSIPVPSVPPVHPRHSLTARHATLAQYGPPPSAHKDGRFEPGGPTGGLSAAGAGGEPGCRGGAAADPRGAGGGTERCGRPAAPQRRAGSQGPCLPPCRPLTWHAAALPDPPCHASCRSRLPRLLLLRPRARAPRRPC